MGWGVLNTASVENDGLLDARLGVAMLCIGACMEDGRKDEGGGGACGGGCMTGRETGIGVCATGRVGVAWLVGCKFFQAMAKAT
jgi:hypothetical protein